MAEYSGRDKRLAYLFEHIGDGGTANLYGTTAPDSSITADDGTLYIQYDDTSYEIVALFAMIEQSWQEINVGGGGGSSGGSARYKEVELWSGTLKTASGTAALSDSIKNFDQILIIWTPHSSNDAIYHITTPIAVSDVILAQAGQFLLDTQWYSNQFMAYISCCFSDAQTLTITEVFNATASTDIRIIKVLGIKWETMQTALIYSTEEREVGVWTDGKPLYQKTIIVNNPTNNTDLEYDLGVTDLDEVISQEGTWDRDLGSGGIWTYDLNATNERAFTNSYIVIARIRNGTKKLYVYVGTTYPDVPCIRFTFRYTKTTDTAGSGTWTTTGEYAHHYSTSEKVIGTWIDGKPLYEMSLEVSATTQNAWTNKDFDVDADVIDTLVEIKGAYRRDSDGWSVALNFWETSSAYATHSINKNTSTGKLKLSYLTRTTTGKVCVTIRYTKTTD